MHDRSQPPVSHAQGLPSIRSFYTDDVLRVELLDSEARNLGEAFARQKGPYFVSKNQLRRFYSDVKQLQYKIEKDLKDKGIKIDSKEPEHLRGYLPLVKMLKAKGAYGSRPGARERVSPQFKKTVEECVELIHTPRDFLAFALFFECVVGYYYGAGGGQ